MQQYDQLSRIYILMAILTFELLSLWLHSFTNKETRSNFKQIAIVNNHKIESSLIEETSSLFIINIHHRNVNKLHLKTPLLHSSELQSKCIENISSITST